MHDFSELKSKYRETIDSIREDQFTSHEFIQRLSQANQRLYIQALYSYVDHDAPFRTVHQKISDGLNARTDLVEQINRDSDSVNIFGEADGCAKWRKVASK